MRKLMSGNRGVMGREGIGIRPYRFTQQFEKAMAAQSDEIIDLFEKKLEIFLTDMFHPSFRTKKIKGLKKPIIWEASLTMNYRFTFQIGENDTIIFRNIGKHSILNKKKF
jgi:mRNA-degrading endonuclease YafQ of YafQ-DinJ toxin-antitoxin module